MLPQRADPLRQIGTCLRRQLDGRGAEHGEGTPPLIGQSENRCAVAVVSIANERQLYLYLWLWSRSTHKRDAHSQGYQPSAESELCPCGHGLGWWHVHGDAEDR